MSSNVTVNSDMEGKIGLFSSGKVSLQPEKILKMGSFYVTTAKAIECVVSMVYFFAIPGVA